MRAGIAHWLRAILRALLGRPLRRASWHLLGRLAPRRDVAGFQVVNVQLAGPEPWVFARVGDVLDLVARTDPLRFARMQRDVRRIAIVWVNGAAAGSYWPDWRACVLAGWHLRDDKVAAVAMTLVHEAVHARLWRRGLRYTRALRPRIERLCVEAEVAFAERLAGSEALVAQAWSDLNATWWSDDEMSARRDAQLRSLGWPEWMLRARRLLFGP